MDGYISVIMYCAQVGTPHVVPSFCTQNYCQSLTKMLVGIKKEAQEQETKRVALQTRAAANSAPVMSVGVKKKKLRVELLVESAASMEAPEVDAMELANLL